jgi:hypothetical protein
VLDVILGIFLTYLLRTGCFCCIFCSIRGFRVHRKPELPILIKFIDAKKDLSVQVHSDDDYHYNTRIALGKQKGGMYSMHEIMLNLFMVLIKMLMKEL